MKGALLAVGAGLFLGLALPPRPAWAQEPARKTSPTPVAARPERITVTVTGLSCPFCAYGLEKRFKKLPGLDSLTIEFETGKVILFVRDGPQLSDGRIRQLLKDAGFEAAKIEPAPLAPAS